MPRKNLASELETNRNYSFEIKSVSGEAVTVPAGAAGAVVVAQLANFPIRNAAGNDIGGFGDTSLALSVSTAFTDEVAHGTADADLANGEYWVDYIRGEIRGRKASTSTSATAAYKIAVLNMSIDDTDVTLTIDQTGLATSTKQDTTNTVLGTTADEAVDSDAVGTVSAKLRGLVKIFADVWDGAANLLRTEEQSAPVAEDNDAGVIKVEERYSTVAIEANATTTHVTGAGFLKGFVVTDVGASANVLDIYDNTAGSGTKMVSQVDTVACQTGYYPVNRAFTTGLTTVLATGTAAKLYLIYEDRSA